MQNRWETCANSGWPGRRRPVFENRKITSIKIHKKPFNSILLQKNPKIRLTLTMDWCTLEQYFFFCPNSASCSRICSARRGSAGCFAVLDGYRAYISLDLTIPPGLSGPPPFTQGRRWLTAFFKPAEYHQRLPRAPGAGCGAD